MKKLLTLAAALLFAGCHAPKGNALASVNATEAQLMGTWYLQKVVDSSGVPNSPSGDSTFTGYNSSYYQIFKADEFTYTTSGSTNWKQETASWGVGVPLDPVSTGSNDVQPGYWYFDNSTNLLTIVNWQFSVLVLSGNQLVLKQVFSTGNNYYYFSK